MGLGVSDQVEVALAVRQVLVMPAALVVGSSVNPLEVLGVRLAPVVALVPAAAGLEAGLVLAELERPSSSRFRRAMVPETRRSTQ